MKKIILYSILFLLLFFQKKLFSQTVEGLTFIPLQFQFFYSKVENTDLIDANTTGWGASYHSEILINININKNFTISSGMGYLFSSEQIKVYENVIYFFNKFIDPNNPFPPSSEDIGRVYLKDMFLTIPVELKYYYSNNDSDYPIFFVIKPELALHLNSFSNADIANIVYDNFLGGDIKHPNYQRIENTIYEEHVENFFDRFTQEALFNTHLGFGTHVPLNEKMVYTIYGSIILYHRKHRPDLLGKKRAIGFNLGISTTF